MILSSPTSSPRLFPFFVGAGAPFSSPYPFSLLLAGRAVARETKRSGDKGFTVLDSRTSGLHVCSRDVSIYCMGETWRLLLRLKISLFQKNSNKFKKSHVSRALRFSCQGPACLEKRKGVWGREWGRPAKNGKALGMRLSRVLLRLYMYIFYNS